MFYTTGKTHKLKYYTDNNSVKTLINKAKAHESKLFPKKLVRQPKNMDIIKFESDESKDNGMCNSS
jgi:hypothetical protein